MTIFFELSGEIVGAIWGDKLKVPSRAKQFRNQFAQVALIRLPVILVAEHRQNHLRRCRIVVGDFASSRDDA